MIDKKELTQLYDDLVRVHSRLLELEQDEDFKKIKFKDAEGFSESATLIISSWTTRSHLFIRRLSAIIKEIPSKRKRSKINNVGK